MLSRTHFGRSGFVSVKKKKKVLRSSYSKSVMYLIVCYCYPFIFLNFQCTGSPCLLNGLVCGISLVCTLSNRSGTFNTVPLS